MEAEEGERDVRDDRMVGGPGAKFPLDESWKGTQRRKDQVELEDQRDEVERRFDADPRQPIKPPLSFLSQTG